MKQLKSLAGVAVGFALFMGAIHFIPGRTNVEIPGTTALQFLIVSVVCTIVAALLSGYTTALIAGYREIPHSSALGMLMIVASFISMLQSGKTHPGWYETAIAGCGPVSALLGAAIRILTKKRD